MDRKNEKENRRFSPKDIVALVAMSLVLLGILFLMPYAGFPN